MYNYDCRLLWYARYAKLQRHNKLIFDDKLVKS